MAEVVPDETRHRSDTCHGGPVGEIDLVVWMSTGEDLACFVYPFRREKALHLEADDLAYLVNLYLSLGVVVSALRTLEW